ncbi:NAD(P)-dependent dehydrogenase (short-subunit alcohol dehydrogenase family) [Friedmanniella endophytica]|uniref:NAD(P)-dependent dehydrogenase (Short-subunit alcohol dehydrogenase family) n=1 Tax=Microlunatus kandeliicorticis TaxID=1759536 RepID=A0A7W3IUG5_9ACTN|nr:SDR family oxidoreductase [Microlunatus kandeliicorticis]MBA8795414.1 NAD(P)-dependent dehydrogenase (short-subunit alcohol dehydrogenase family) [Microlunatus kandeliicorticis]
MSPTTPAGSAQRAGSAQEEDTMAVLDSFGLGGRTTVVTGANRGIGRALAVALAEAGSDLALLVRDPASCAEVEAECRALGVRTLAVAGDVTDAASVARAVDTIGEAFGRIDVLVNNAGACIHRPALEVTAAEWRQVMDVNVDGVWNCAQAFGRVMVEAGRGAIVNIGSISAVIVNRPQWQPAYNASKAAAHQLTKSLAAEWAEHGVRVNALAPGYVKTEMAPVDDPQFRQRWIDDVPMQRFALPAELGPAVVFLASDASSFMTGSVLVMDGGYTTV